MRILCIKHVPFEGPGYFEKLCEEKGWPVSTVEIYAGEDLPPMDSFDLLLVMGGPMGVDDEGQCPWLTAEKRFLREVLSHEDKKILGVCLGAQLLAEALGGRITPNPGKEIGWFPVEVKNEGVFRAFPQAITPLHWHGDTFSLPEGATHLARSAGCENQAFSWQESRAVGLQFHLETSPDSLKQLIDNCEDKSDKGMYIQTGDQMTAQSFHILSNMKLCDVLLTEMA